MLCNIRDVEEGKVGNVFGTEAGQAFYCVVARVLLVLEECFPVFSVEGRPSVRHCHVNKSSFACEANFLDYFSELCTKSFGDNNANCVSSVNMLPHLSAILVSQFLLRQVEACRPSNC